MTSAISIFKLLSDETRFRIIMLISDHALCVCQITGILEVSQPKVSKGLSKLRDLGLVEDERMDKFVYYKLKKNPLLDSIISTVESDYLNETLTRDQERLADRNSYLTTCNIIPAKL